jgi:hypothetical protein
VMANRINDMDPAVDYSWLESGSPGDRMAKQPP